MSICLTNDLRETTTYQARPYEPRPIHRVGRMGMQRTVKRHNDVVMTGSGFVRVTVKEEEL